MVSSAPATATQTVSDAPVSESILEFYKTTAGGQRVYRNREAPVRDVYVPEATADQLGNPERIKLTITPA